MPAKRRKDGFDRVRIPIELSAKLDECLAALQLEILQDAVSLAAQRGAASGDFVLQAQDLVDATKNALPGLPIGLKKALSRRERHYVRRAS